jgi:DNA-binding transcriptional LysR family regulator
MLTDHLEKLTHFCGVFRAGSIRGYALEMGLSQPGVSRAIQLLEMELETTLFLRNGKGYHSPRPGGSF